MWKCLGYVPAKNVWLSSLRRKVTLSPATMFMVSWQPWILIISLRNENCLQANRSQVWKLFCSIMATCCHHSSWLCSQYEGIIWQHKAPSKLRRLQEIPMAALWRLESCCCISWTAAGLHEVVLFLMWMGQSGKDFPLQEEGLALLTITGTGNKAPTAGRIQQHFAALTSHQIRTNEELR